MYNVGGAVWYHYCSFNFIRVVLNDIKAEINYHSYVGVGSLTKPYWMIHHKKYYKTSKMHMYNNTTQM